MNKSGFCNFINIFSSFVILVLLLAGRFFIFVFAPSMSMSMKTVDDWNATQSIKFQICWVINAKWIEMKSKKDFAIFISVADSKICSA